MLRVPRSGVDEGETIFVYFLLLPRWVRSQSWSNPDPERILPSVLWLRNLAQPGDFISGKNTKPPRIAIPQLGSVGDRYCGVGVLFHLAGGEQIREPSGHSEMDEPEQARLHFGNQVFAAAMDSADGPAPELSGNRYFGTAWQKEVRTGWTQRCFPTVLRSFRAMVWTSGISGSFFGRRERGGGSP